MIRSKKIRESARNERCTLEIFGVCNGDITTTVLAHLPDESHGMGIKADDISACYACSNCHDVIDGRVPFHFLEGEKEWYMRRAQTRTIRRLIDTDILKLT